MGDMPYHLAFHGGRQCDVSGRRDWIQGRFSPDSHNVIDGSGIHGGRGDGEDVLVLKERSVGSRRASVRGNRGVR